jgi:hypothetical protein
MDNLNPYLLPSRMGLHFLCRAIHLLPLPLLPSQAGVPCSVQLQAVWLNSSNYEVGKCSLVLSYKILPPSYSLCSKIFTDEERE